MIKLIIPILLMANVAMAQDLLECGGDDFLIPDGYTPTQLETDLCHDLKQAIEVEADRAVYGDLARCEQAFQDYEDSQTQLRRAKRKIKNLTKQLKGKR